KDDQVPDAAFVGQGVRAARDLDRIALEVRGERVQAVGVLDFPTVEGRTFTVIATDHHSLLAIVHAQRERGAALVDELHAEETCAVGFPVVEVLALDPDISERLQSHRTPPVRACAWRDFSMTETRCDTVVANGDTAALR